MPYQLSVIAQISTPDGRPYDTDDPLRALFDEQYAARVSGSIETKDNLSASQRAALQREHRRIVKDMEKDSAFTIAIDNPEGSKQSPTGWKTNAIAAHYRVTDGDGHHVAFFGVARGKSAPSQETMTLTPSPKNTPPKKKASKKTSKKVNKKPKKKPK